MKELEQGKEAGGPWDCYHANNFSGWEADRVVVVTSWWHNIMEIISRAKTMLALIIVSDDTVADPIKYFMQVAKVGLVEIVSDPDSGMGPV